MKNKYNEQSKVRHCSTDNNLHEHSPCNQKVPSDKNKSDHSSSELFDLAGCILSLKQKSDDCNRDVDVAETLMNLKTYKQNDMILPKTDTLLDVAHSMLDFKYSNEGNDDIELQDATLNNPPFDEGPEVDDIDRSDIDIIHDLMRDNTQLNS